MCSIANFLSISTSFFHISVIRPECWDLSYLQAASGSAARPVGWWIHFNLLSLALTSGTSTVGQDISLIAYPERSIIYKPSSSTCTFESLSLHFMDANDGSNCFFRVAKKKTGAPLVAVMRNLKNEKGWNIFGWVQNPVTYDSKMRNGIKMRTIQLGQNVYAWSDTWDLSRKIVLLCSWSSSTSGGSLMHMQMTVHVHII